MPEIKKQSEPEKDKYERVKEELGYNDEEIRILSHSVKRKALGLLGNEKERKLTYLMREREKRDKKEAAEMMQKWDKIMKGAPYYWREDVGKGYADFRKKLKVFNYNPKFFHGFNELLQHGRDWFKEAQSLMDAQRVYGLDEDMFQIFAKIARYKGNEACKALITAKSVYGEDAEKFKIFTDITEKGGARACNFFIELESLYRGDAKTLRELADLAVPVLTYWHDKCHHENTYDVISAAKNVYGVGRNFFEGFIKVMEKGGPQACNALFAARKIYGNAKDMFDIVLSIEIDRSNHGESIEVFTELEGLYKGDVAKCRQVGEAIKLLAIDHLDHFLPENRALFGDDLGKFYEVVKLFHKDIDIKSGYSDRYGQLQAVTAAKSIYGSDMEMFQAVESCVVDFGKKNAYNSKLDLLKKLNGVYEGSLDNFKTVIGILEKIDTKEKLSCIEQWANIYGNSIERFKIMARYLEKDYPLYQFAAQLYVELTESNPSGEVDMRQICRVSAENGLEQPDFCKHIVDAYKVDSLRGFFPDWVQDFFKVLAQVNIAALSAKVDDHFRPFNLGKGNAEKKKEVLKIYGEFLSEFNGTLVPVVWHLYYLLKDPTNAVNSLSNIQELNSLRELEKIAEFSDLQLKIHDIKEGILLGHVDVDRYVQSDFALAILDDIAKVSASDWKREGRPLRAIVAGYEKDEDKIIAGFNPHIYRSGLIPVREVLKPMQKDPALTAQAVKIQDAVKRFIKPDASGFVEENVVLESFKDGITAKVSENISKAETALERGENAKGEKIRDKAIPFIRNSIDQLKTFLVRLKSVTKLEELVHILFKEKPKDLDCEKEVCEIFYYFGAQKQKLYTPDSWVHLSPDLIDASQLHTFIRDTIFLEVVGGKSNDGKPDISLDRGEKKTLKGEFSGIGNFLDQKQAEEKAYKEHTAATEKSIAILAGRGLLAELSGFYCDACWTQQADILKNNPTMVGHTMVENFEEKEKSRIIGGCLTLESSTKVVDAESVVEHDGKVLVVRGLNPQNASIKKFDVADFVENFLDYVQETGRKAGAEYIVLPLFNTGALSNRPEVNTYLAQKYKNAVRVSLNDDMYFNGYHIKDSCVVVRVVKDNARKGKLPKPSNVPPDKQDQWIGSW